MPRICICILMWILWMSNIPDGDMSLYADQPYFFLICIRGKKIIHKLRKKIYMELIVSNFLDFFA